MRDIIFRGKRIDNGEWVYGCLLNNIYGASKPLIISDSSYTDDNRVVNDDWEFVKPETVGQYSGLTDRSGERIFEGDIVKAPYIDPIFQTTWDMDKEPTEIALVEFNKGQYYISYIDGEYKFTVDSSKEHIKVIGNIHDNPELLNKR